MAAADAHHTPSGNVDEAELAKFEAMADAWWDPAGELRLLHRLNPVRLGFVRDHALAHFGREPGAARPLAGLRAIDIGCGGGLVCEPLAGLGADVTGIDAATRNVEVARAHAREAGIAVDYRHATAEDLAAAGERFDIVASLEVIEHVPDPRAFLGACAALMAPGGALFLATLNRTPQAFALAILGAEYVLGWLPRGTHDWRRFLKPSEIAAFLRPHGVEVSDLGGLRYSLASGDWSLGRDLGVNYMAYAVRRSAPS